MAPGIPDIEGSAHGHDVIPIKSALRYFEARGKNIPGLAKDTDLAALYGGIKPVTQPYLHTGSTEAVGANRVVFGEAVNMVLDAMDPAERAKKVMVIDSTFHWFD
jgi:hypothetical protein